MTELERERQKDVINIGYGQWKSRRKKISICKLAAQTLSLQEQRCYTRMRKKTVIRRSDPWFPTDYNKMAAFGANARLP